MSHDDDRLLSNPSDAELMELGGKALRDDFPGDARLNRLEQRLASALAEETPPRWRRHTFYSLAGAAILAAGAMVASLGLGSGGTIHSAASPSVTHLTRTLPANSEASVATPRDTSEAVDATPTVSIDALPDARPGAPPRALASARTVLPRTAPSRVDVRPAPRVCEDEELALLEQARRSLASDPSTTLALAAEHTRRFHASCIVEEREVLAIDALGRLGRHDDAVRRAASFEVAFPSSAHLDRVRALVAR